MKINVVLSLVGRQTYPDQEPEVVEMMTDGTMEKIPTGWEISYEESALTGLEGVRTGFRVEEGCVTLSRTGKLRSQMVFRQGVPHDSLYQSEFGTLMMTVCASSIQCDLSEEGGTVDLRYQIEIEHSMSGTVDYHLEVKPKKARI